MEWLDVQVRLTSWDGVIVLGFLAMWHIAVAERAISRVNARYAILAIALLSAALLGLRIYLNL